MKRNKERVPEFDEIIFENRNKTYGAFDLRKRYQSVKCLSILCGSAMAVILVIIFSLSTRDSIALSEPNSITIVLADPLIPDIVVPVVPKGPSRPDNTLKNLEPVVTEDSLEISSYIPSTDEIVNKTKNGDVNDTIHVFTVQTDLILPQENEPRLFVEEMPEFPGGISAMLKFVSSNLEYPGDAIQNNIQGKVILKFVVNSDGSVDRIEVIRGIDPSLDAEAIRVINKLPHFKPGKQNGVAVPVWFTIPVVFQIKVN